MVLADWNMQNPLLSISAYIVIRAFLLILKTHERMFGKCLCETCSTVNTWPYFFERVLSGQKDGYDCKKIVTVMINAKSLVSNKVQHL